MTYLKTHTLAAALCAAAGAHALAQTSPPELYITDQPDVALRVTDAVGLPDGGFVTVGFDGLDDEEDFRWTPAVALARYAPDGTLRWERGYRMPTRERYVDYGNRYYLATLGGRGYVFTAEDPAPTGATPAGERAGTVVEIDLATGAELTRVPTPSIVGVDTVGETAGFAVTDDAYYLLKHVWPDGQFSEAGRSVAEVRGRDGSLRGRAVVGAYDISEVHAWPEADAALVLGAEAFVLTAAADTVSLSLAPEGQTGLGGRLGAHLGERMVYLSRFRDSAALLLHVLTYDGGEIAHETSTLDDLPATANVAGLVAWGPDSFALYVERGAPDFERAVTVYAADGTPGRRLDGDDGLLLGSYIDGPNEGYLPNHHLAPPAYRIRARHFWLPDPTGVVDFETGDTLAIPNPQFRPDTTLLDDVRFVVLDERDRLLGMRYPAAVTGDEHPTWTRLDGGGGAPAFQPAIPLREGRVERIDPLGGPGLAVVSSDYRGQSTVHLLGTDLALRRSAPLPEAFRTIWRSARHPDGGIVYGTVDRQTGGSTVRVGWLTADGTFTEYDIRDLVRGDERETVREVSVGPDGDLALVTSVFSSGRRDDYFAVRDVGGVTRAPLCDGCDARDIRIAFAPDGGLLQYWPDGKYAFSPRDGEGRLVETDSARLWGTGSGNVLYEAYFSAGGQLLLSWTEGSAETAVAATGVLDLSLGNLSELSRALPGTMPTGLLVGGDGAVYQQLYIGDGYRGVYATGARVSDTRELAAGDITLVARSPFRGEVVFVSTGGTRGADIAVRLCDASGREVAVGPPRDRGDGTYALTAPRSLPPGVYFLYVGQRAAAIVKE